MASLGWYKSSHSSGDSGQCLEVATTPGALYVRDSAAQFAAGVGSGPR
ncbi:DUF397 domain-containing protein [Streptomyces sp. H27-H5]|nr:DUF397 domain-containing protein [Streptomyces sp. H27-G5]MCY0924422.1 DUF397 domain-containing protein [Streptomyces sp. H27-G5]MCY0962872.1 DUF397 domain-containing protein [Streptomyces sp. H27-H5]